MHDAQARALQSPGAALTTRDGRSFSGPPAPADSPELMTEIISVSSSWQWCQRRNLPTETLIFGPARWLRAIVPSIGYSLLSGGSIARAAERLPPRWQGHLQTRTPIRARHCSSRLLRFVEKDLNHPQAL